jgi:hypothetical protein
LEVHTVVWAFFFADAMAVRSKEASTPMMAITVSNSMRVKA